MEYIKSRDTLTSRLGTGPSVNQEMVEFLCSKQCFVFAACDGEKASDSVEHKQHFMVVNPDSLEWDSVVQHVRNGMFKKRHLGVNKKQNICDKPATISCLPCDFW